MPRAGATTTEYLESYKSLESTAKAIERILTFRADNPPVVGNSPKRKYVVICLEK
jgi:hypothetical protein